MKIQQDLGRQTLRTVSVWHALPTVLCCGVFCLASQAVEGRENFTSRNTEDVDQVLLSAYPWWSARSPVLVADDSKYMERG